MVSVYFILILVSFKLSSKTFHYELLFSIIELLLQATINLPRKRDPTYMIRSCHYNDLQVDHKRLKATGFHAYTDKHSALGKFLSKYMIQLETQFLFKKRIPL